MRLVELVSKLINNNNKKRLVIIITIINKQVKIKGLVINSARTK